MSLNRTVFGFLMMLGFVALFSGSSYGFDPADLAKLKATKSCQKCDLTKADLSKMDLRGAKLMEAKLMEANLAGADLTLAQLYFSNLKGADLTGAKLSGAQLTNAFWVDGRLCDHGSLGHCK